MNSKQKKVIAWTFFVLLLIFGTVGVVLWIYGYIAQDEIAHYVGIATAWVSPSLLIGLASKWLLGKHQAKTAAKNIDNLLIESGLKKAPEPITKPIKIDKHQLKGTPLKTIHGFEIYYEPMGKILLIKIPELNNKTEYLKEFEYVLNELKEELRKMG